MIWSLGIGGSNHDFSAALLCDGDLHTAIEDERLTGHRYGDTHWASRPCRPSFDYCLEAAGIEPSELSGLFVSSDLEGHDRFWQNHSYELVGHHLCHASAAFYPSPFESAAVLVIDGRGGPVGENDRAKRTFETISIGKARGQQISLKTVQTGVHAVATSTWSYISSNSVGWFYSIITEACGLGENGEGKTMALAAYGKPVFKDALEEFVTLNDETIFIMDPYGGLWDFLVDTIQQAPDSFTVRANLAASGQAILEDSVIRAAKRAKQETGESYLAFGGGVALNGVANHRIREESGFDEVFVFPASGDNGLSAGAALYGTHSLLGVSREQASWKRATRFAYGGRRYPESDIVAAIERAPLSSRHIPDPPALATILAEHLLADEIIAIYQGGAEFGPRALGNRSILALPSGERVQARMNEIKQRETFRPFAPIVLEEDANTFFELKGPSPFMLDIAPVRHEFRDKLAGICHVDGTARVQTLGPDSNPFIRAVLERLKLLDEPAVVLNTSFNLKGQPIVETPSDAISAFLKMSLDALVLETRWVEKQTALSLNLPGLTRHAY